MASAAMALSCPDGGGDRIADRGRDRARLRQANRRCVCRFLDSGVRAVARRRRRAGGAGPPPAAHPPPHPPSPPLPPPPPHPPHPLAPHAPFPRPPALLYH